MVNFAVINLKGAIKRVLKIAIILLFIVGIINLSELLKNVDYEISFVDLVKNNINYESNDTAIEFTDIVLSQVPILTDAKTDENNSIANLEENVEEITEEVTDDTSSVSVTEEETTDLQNLSTEVISENNISESYNTLYGSVKIKNETSFELTEDILTPDVEYTNISDIVIFHTHTCESYTATEENSYTASGNYRTTDLNYSVAQVGTVLSELLTGKGYNVNSVSVNKSLNGKHIVNLNLEFDDTIRDKSKIKNIADIISRLFGEKFAFQKDRKNLKTGVYVQTYSAQDKFALQVGSSKMTKEGSKISGDSNLQIRLEDGKYLLAISDGMGTRKRCETS